MLSHRLLSLVFAFSVLVVWGHWNFFTQGYFALGLNFSLFWFGVALIIYALDASYSFKQDWPWLIPICLIIISYSMYENPWLKAISLFLLPVVVGVFCAYSHFRSRSQLDWNAEFLGTIVKRFFKPLTTRNQAFDGLATVAEDVAYKRGVIDKLLLRVLFGLVILIPLGYLVILLLTSADEAFGEFVLDAVRVIFDGMSWMWLWKLLLACLLTVMLLTIAAGWAGTIEYTESTVSKKVDGLVAGIVLGGLLIIYAAFLLLQLDNLVIEELPEKYKDAERMVKSGFWQLFTLAALNTFLFFVVYRKTGLIAQWVLRFFIVASSLLMVSAAWKLWLYVYTFGLSYEKFFAAFTAIFSLAVLLYLVVASFSTIRCNVIKTIAFAALWSYAIAAISPVERIIFNANVTFSQQDNTRIILSQLTQLSLDIQGDVNEVGVATLNSTAQDQSAWRTWRADQLRISCYRPWYELTLTRLRVCP